MPTSEQEVRRASADEVRGLVTADLRALKLLWADDFVVTNPLNTLANKQQVVQMVETGTLAFQSYDRQIEYIRVEGDVAVLAGRETVIWTGKMPLAGRATTLRFTAVWMKKRGRWQEIIRHANIVP